MSEITVSVCMITHNHENYIREAIEGVLMQKTNFSIELVIGEDCSTDNTRVVCEEYVSKYPSIINLLPSETNLGIIPNLIRTLKTSNGKYIALCEGDDYWTEPLKLQKQVDFLEANRDFSICFHNVKVKLENRGEIVDDFITQDVSDCTDIYNLLRGNYIHTPSVVFINNEQVMSDFQSLKSLPMGDYPLFLLNARYGKIKKISEVMAVYRYGVGIWTSENVKKDNSMINFMLYNALLGKFNDDINKIILLRFRSYFKAVFSIDYYPLNQETIDDYLSKNKINDVEILSTSLFKAEFYERDFNSIKKMFKRLVKLLILKVFNKQHA